MPQRPPAEAIREMAPQVGPAQRDRAPQPEQAPDALHPLARLQSLHGNQAVRELVAGDRAGNGASHDLAGGAPVDASSRRPVEQLIGTDLSDVRVHVDGAADAAARSVGAAALTIGRDLFFRPDRFAPGTPAGERLLAHELVHAAQSRQTLAPAADVVSREADAAEAQARQLADLREVNGTDRLVGGLRAPSAVISLAPETWYRGDAVGAVPPKPGAYDHDLGNGLYLTNDRDVADLYADTRVKENARLHPDVPATSARTRSVAIERADLGKVLDLTTDKRWNDYLSEPIAGHTREGLIRKANENYPRFFKTFVEKHGIDLKQYDAIIGPEFVRGGKQICIRNPAKIQEIEKLFKQLTRVPTPPKSGGPSGSGGAGAAERPKAGAPAPEKPPVTKPAPATPTPVKPSAPVKPSVKPPTVTTEGPSPKPARKPLSFRRPSYGSGIARVGVSLGASVGSGILLGWMWEAMKKSAAETPSPRREVKEAGGFLKAIRNKDNLKTIDLTSTTTYEYANGGFAAERSELYFQYFQAYGEIDSLADAADRRTGISHLQRETLASINELETMLDNVNNALKLEKDFQEKIDAANDLHTGVLYGADYLFKAGIPVEDISQILSNLKSYASLHQLTVQGLKTLRTAIANARDSDLRLLKMLNAAWERGALTAVGAAAPPSSGEE